MSKLYDTWTEFDSKSYLVELKEDVIDFLNNYANITQDNDVRIYNINDIYFRENKNYRIIDIKV